MKRSLSFVKNLLLIFFARKKKLSLKKIKRSNMNFFEVKIGKTSRRGNFESFNSFVAKTDMHSHELYNSLRERYKGFEVSINNVETIVEFEKPVVVEENVFEPSVEKSTVQHLSLEGTCRDLGEESEIGMLREDFISKMKEFEVAEQKLRSVILKYLESKHSEIAYEVLNLKNIYSGYFNYKYTLKLKGDLKQMLEEDGK